MSSQITTPTNSFVVRYPQAVDFATKQLGVFWPPDEIHVDKDTQDILVNLTPAERHGVITVLKLFSIYEFYIGKEYWNGVVAEWFPRPEIMRMASVFGMFELAIHQPFYAKLNEVIGLATDDFYLSYVNDPILNERMEFIESLQSKNKATSLAIFSMLEGCVLYSSFSYLKHFQSRGKNKLVNVVRGINFSVRDEGLHSLAGAWLCKQYIKEEGLEMPVAEILEAAEYLRQHEYRIADMIYEKGKIEGITATQQKHFIDSRLNLCLNELGIPSQYEVKYNPIAEWFYDGINNFQFNDFFQGQGREYSRDWNEHAFTWDQE